MGTISSGLIKVARGYVLLGKHGQLLLVLCCDFRVDDSSPAILDLPWVAECLPRKAALSPPGRPKMLVCIPVGPIGRECSSGDSADHATLLFMHMQSRIRLRRPWVTFGWVSALCVGPALLFLSQYGAAVAWIFSARVEGGLPSRLPSLHTY